MCKFKAGDYFVVKSNRLKGQVLDVVADKTKELYQVSWEGFGMLCHYETSIVDAANDWEIDLTRGGVFASMYEPSSVEDKSCSHDFVEYNGFTESYRYCKLCDMKEH